MPCIKRYTLSLLFFVRLLCLCLFLSLSHWYVCVAQAIEKALIDRIPASKMATEQAVVMVVGAGRGPIVRAALKAAEQCNRQIKLYAVEKNANAVVT